MPLTIQQALSRATGLRPSSDSWRLDTELLLAEAMATTREYLLTWPERELDAQAQQVFEALFARRAAGEPLAYILGRKDFWDFQLLVNPHVLIPRPETELLVECALAIARQQAGEVHRVVDLGTGSGAIAIALARELPHCEVLAVERSAEALVVARANAARLGVGNLRLQQGSWCEGIEPASMDLVVSNPPYVAEGDRHLQQGGLRFEPGTALVASDNGLGDIKSIAGQSRTVLRNKGWLLVEHGYQQGSDVKGIFNASGYRNVEVRQDLADLDRVTLGQWLDD